MTLSNAARPLQLLMVDDDAGFTYLVRLIVNELPVPTPLAVVPSVEKALKFLRREGEYVDAPQPDLILLDYQLPKQNGLALLREIRSSEAWRLLPVVMMSGVGTQEVIREAYLAGANTYLIKPLGLDELVRTFRLLSAYWAKMAALPT